MKYGLGASRSATAAGLAEVAEGMVCARSYVNRSMNLEVRVWIEIHQLVVCQSKD